MVCGNMEVEAPGPRSYMDNLYDNNTDKVLGAVVELKNNVIGSQKQKELIVEQGVLARLVHLLVDPDMPSILKTEVVYILDSMLKGRSPSCVKVVADLELPPLLLGGLSSPDPQLLQACLTCLRTCLLREKPSPGHSLGPQALASPYSMADLEPLRDTYLPPGLDTNHRLQTNTGWPGSVLFSEGWVVSQLVALLGVGSTNQQITVTDILAAASDTREHQAVLIAAGLPEALSIVLSSHVSSAQLSGLRCLASVVQGNPEAALLVAGMQGGHTDGEAVGVPGSDELVSLGPGEGTHGSGKSLLSQVISFTGREHPLGVQLHTARVLTYLYRQGALEGGLCLDGGEGDTFVLPAEGGGGGHCPSPGPTPAPAPGVITYRVLPCLVRACKGEQGEDYRVLAAHTLAYLIEVSAELQRIAAISNRLISTMSEFLRVRQGAQEQEMKRAAFSVFASLGANDEDIRKKIIDTEPLMESVVAALESTDSPLQMAAIRCLHSLSRSVQLLRTTFQEHTVWQPLMKIMSEEGAKLESLVVASSTLCNLILEFSPSKERILEGGALELLCSLTHKYDPSLRLNGVWGLMNMAFQADQRIKAEIMTTLGTDQIFRLLSDTEIHVVKKTLGLVRNLLSTKQHIDHITGLAGKQLMQAVVLILESEHLPEVKEQALCILANIADGDSAKKLIVDNEDMLRKVTGYMMHSNTKLQIAAVVCVQNLIWRNDEGSAERQARLKDMGVFKILHQLLTTSDTVLFEKVKMALQQLTM